MKSSSSRESGPARLLLPVLMLSLVGCQSTLGTSQRTDREVAAGVCSIVKVVRLPARFADDASLTDGERRLSREVRANNAALRAYGCG